MNQSLNEFGRRLDDLHAEGRGIVNEGLEAVVVSGLDTADAASLVGLARAAELTWSAEDSADDSLTDVARLDEDLAPYRLTIVKPDGGSSLVLFTILALRKSLEEDLPAPSWKHVQSAKAFSTAARRFAVWEESTLSSNVAFRRPDPRDLVRESGRPSIPARIEPWLLDMPFSDAPEGDPVFDEWAKLSVDVARKCLASEILADGTIVYAGPPKTKVSGTDPLPLTRNLLFALQRALRWVYETTHQAEIRHNLLGAELGRHSIERGISATVVASGLEGAKIAYQLALSDISRDSLKAIADVRKAVTEEINKTADTARQLATAVAGSVFLGLGVVAARVTSTAPPALLITLAMVLAIYVGAMIFASHHFMSLQENLRSDWKQRFYSFLGANDYETLVTQPLRKAKHGFVIVSMIALVISVSMVVVVIFLVSSDAVPIPTKVEEGAVTETLTGE